VATHSFAVVFPRHRMKFSRRFHPAGSAAPDVNWCSNGFVTIIYVRHLPTAYQELSPDHVSDTRVNPFTSSYIIVVLPLIETAWRGGVRSTGLSTTRDSCWMRRALSVGLMAGRARGRSKRSDVL